MKLVLHITLTVLSGISLAGLLTGCAIPMKEDIARSTTEFNMIAEKAGNEMLLLNIVRASKRRPMYFTSIGTLRGNKTFKYGTGGITIPFGRIGGGLDGSYSIAPSASYTNSPGFDVTALNTQEFTRGIMTPVSMDTIEYYWSQGWHKEMLLHLFIRRIEIIEEIDKKWKVTEQYDNYPGNPEIFELFQNQIRTKDWKWDIEEVNATSTVKVLEDANDASQLKNLIEAQKAGLKLRPVKNNKMKLCLSKYFFTREPNEPNEPAKNAKKDNTTGDKKITFGVNNTGDKKRGRVYIRSPEAILYYLGEILRVEIRGENKQGKNNGKMDPNTYAPMISAGHGPCQAKDNRLFYAREVTDKKVTDKDEKPCVSVVYEGDRYVIPGAPDTNEGCCTDRSMHVLSLVSQLIGQQKKIEEAPTTATVSVIGR